MPAPYSETHIDKTQARAGTTPGVVRYVLGISLGLVIIALSAIWMSGAFSASDDSRRPTEVSQQQAG